MGESKRRAPRAGVKRARVWPIIRLATGHIRRDVNRGAPKTYETRRLHQPASMRLTRLLTAAIVAVSGICATAGAVAADLDIRIQLKWFHQFQFAGYYAAVEKGYFREAGLNVTLLEGGPHINPTETVLAGKAEFGIGTSGLLVTRSRGKPVVAVASIFQHSPYILIARDEPGIRTVADLEGRTIMVEPYSEELVAYLYHQGVDPDAIETTEHTGNPLDIYGGNIVGMTAYTTTEPFVLDQRGKSYRIFDPKVAGIDFYGDTLYTTETFASQHKDRTEALRESLIKGWRYALRHPEELIELIKRKYDVPETREQLRFEARDIRRLLIPDLVEIGYMNPTRWQQIAEEFAAAELLESKVDMDAFIFKPDEATDWRFLLHSFLATLALMLIITGVVVHLYRLNRRLAAENQQRIALEEELRSQTITDFATGIYNRRGFLEILERELARSDREGTPLSLIAIDLDGFKRINDEHGHAVGDRVLVRVAAALSDQGRAVDITGRVGGEEFMVALPDTGPQGAHLVAERLCRFVDEADVTLDDGRRVTITASLGVITRIGDEDIDAMMLRADQAMYQAKRQGGNRVVGDTAA